MTSLFRISTAALMAISALGLTTLPANAAACRDAHGRFTKCPASLTHSTKKPAVKHAVNHTPAKKAAMSPSKNTMENTRIQSHSVAPKAPATSSHKS